MAVVLVVGGLILLTAGGEILVRGATGLARTIGLSPLVVGLTVVSFATSAPELAVSVQGAVGGTPGIAIGNVVGSNVANVLFVLGICALVLPLSVRSQLVKTDIPVMAAFCALALVMALDGSFGRLDGAVLIAGLAIYVSATLILSRRRWAAVSRADSRPRTSTQLAPMRPVLTVLLIAAGVALLVVGARLLVSGAVDIASALGVSDLVIGLTIVSVGTSLPEIAASLIAVVRGERDLAVGNVVGSCLFNIGAVLGISSVIVPGGIPVETAAINVDFPVMVAVSLVLIPIAFTGFTISRWEGGLFLAYYLAYVAYLLLDATGRAAVEPFSNAMLGLVIPITLLWLGFLVAYEFRLRHRGKRSPPGHSNL